MEITGNVVFVNSDFIRIRTVKKKQEIDVFFTDPKRVAIKILFHSHMIATIEVEIQSLVIGENKFAKIWFIGVMWPALPDEKDLSAPQKARIDIIKVLYPEKKDNDWDINKYL